MVIEALNNQHFGGTIADGTYAEVEVADATTEVARVAVQAVYNALRGVLGIGSATRAAKYLGGAFNPGLDGGLEHRGPAAFDWSGAPVRSACGGGLRRRLFAQRSVCDASARALRAASRRKRPSPRQCRMATMQV